MKPNFALTLSADAVSLLYRGDSGWTCVGTVPLDDGDVAAGLASMQMRARALSDDLSCKLVIPNDQLKYLSIEAKGDPDEAVRAVLEGATPYAVNDLEYDWTAVDGVIQIVAVARDTLAEAEAFATGHGFDAVSFAAIPEGSSFGGEPFFGVTTRAAATLPKGTMVARDDSPIRIIDDTQIPEAEPAPEPEPEIEDMPGSEGMTDDAPVASAATKAVADAPAAPKRDVPEDAPTDASASIGKGSQPLAQTPAKPDSSDAAGKFTSIRATRGDNTASPTQPLLGESRLSRIGGAVPASDAAQGATTPLPSPASDSASDPARLAELAASLTPDPEARLDRGAAEAPSQQSAAVAPQKPGQQSHRKTRSRKAVRKPSAGASFEDEKHRMTVFGARQREVGGKPRFLGLILTALLLLFLVGVAAWASIYLDEGLARFFGRGNDIKLVDVPPPDDSGLDSVEDPVGDSAFLAPQDAIAPLPGTLPDTDTERGTSSLPGSRDVTALPNLPSPLSPSEALASYAATGIWQMAPTSPEIPSAGAPLNDLYTVSIDPTVAEGEPAILPRRVPDARDVALETPVNPPPAGTRFDFDDRGFVRATPDGTRTPQGVRVVAGRPPMTPPADMAQAVTVTATPATAESELPAGTTFIGDPALADTRPRLRPNSLVAAGATSAAPPEAEPETREDGENTNGAAEDSTQIADTAAQTVAPGNPSLAAARPQARPARITAEAATLQSTQSAASAPLVEGAALTRALNEAGAAADSIDPEDDADQAVADSFEDATEQAVSASLIPLRRPGNFGEIVKRTRARAAAQPVPDNQRLQPSMPSSASVARQATTENAINLRKINLIGVYGSTSSRRALVRMGNGSYKKVQVGDRLDGGQVAAIGESELRYIKSGRNLVLRIPEG